MFAAAEVALLLAGVPFAVFAAAAVAVSAASVSAPVLAAEAPAQGEASEVVVEASEVVVVVVDASDETTTSHLLYVLWLFGRHTRTREPPSPQEEVVLWVPCGGGAVSC